jgi:hypothetical protein
MTGKPTNMSGWIIFEVRHSTTLLGCLALLLLLLLWAISNRFGTALLLRASLPDSRDCHWACRHSSTQQATCTMAKGNAAACTVIKSFVWESRFGLFNCWPVHECQRSRYCLEEVAFAAKGNQHNHQVAFTCGHHSSR